MKVLVIAVHPDDETLGCGGTLLKHKKKGDEINCLFVTSGNEEQQKLIGEVAESYGFNNYLNLFFPENQLDDISLNDLIPKISSYVNSTMPDVLYIPNRSDVHSDHRRVHEAMLAIKTFRYPFIKKVLMYEVISETDFAYPLTESVFMPNVFVDITEVYDEKTDILTLYESELLYDPMTRSYDVIEAHNKYRGSQINAEYAECFMLLKEIA